MFTRVRQKVKTDTPINLFDLRSFRLLLKFHRLLVREYLLLILSTCQLVPLLSTCHTCSPFVYWFYSRFIYSSRLLISPLLVSSCLLCLLFSSIIYPILLMYTCSVPLEYFLLLLFTCCFSSSLLAVSQLVYLLFLFLSTCCFSFCLLAFSHLVYLLFLFSYTCCSYSCLLAVPPHAYLIYFMFNCCSSCLLVPHLTCLSL